MGNNTNRGTCGGARPPETDIIGGFQYAEPDCNGCGKPLTVDNAWMTDGCPCNSALGINSMNETRWRLLMQLQQDQSRQFKPGGPSREIFKSQAELQKANELADDRLMTIAALRSELQALQKDNDRMALQIGTRTGNSALDECERLQAELQAAQAELDEVRLWHIDSSEQLAAAQEQLQAAREEVAAAEMAKKVQRDTDRRLQEKRMEPKLMEPSREAMRPQLRCDKCEAGSSPVLVHGAYAHRDKDGFFDYCTLEPHIPERMVNAIDDCFAALRSELQAAQRVAREALEQLSVVIIGKAEVEQQLKAAQKLNEELEAREWCVSIVMNDDYDPEKDVESTQLILAAKHENDTLRSELQAEKERADEAEASEMRISKKLQLSHENCACEYDDDGGVCLVHYPAKQKLQAELQAARQRIEEVWLERDEAKRVRDERIAELEQQNDDYTEQLAKRGKGKTP